MKKRLLVSSLLFITAGFSQTISTEAPSVSASAVTVPSGFLQGELSGGFSINNDATSPIVGSSEVPFLLVRYGLKERLELRLQSQSTYDPGVVGSKYRYRQFGIGAKYAILPNDGKTNLAVIGNFSPFVNSWRSQQGDLILAFSRSLGNSSSIGANAGYSIFAARSESGNTEFSYQNMLGSLAYSWSFLDDFTVFGEFFYNYSQSSFADGAFTLSGDSYGVDFGLQYLLRDNIQLDWVSGFSLSSKSQFHSIGFNIYLNTNK